MAEIILTRKESIPSMRLIGKKYGDADRVDGMFGTKWGEWDANGWFDSLKKLGVPDGYDYGDVGYMTHGKDGQFQYWIGRFTPGGSQVPEGYDFLDFEAVNIGVCHVLGQQPDIYMKEDMCYERLKADGYKVLDQYGCFERYNPPRFLTLDENGNIILDVCFFVA